MRRYKPRWIDPAEERPADGQVVLVESQHFGVVCSKYVADCDYAQDGFRWSSPGFATFGPVYRWCAVPPLPPSPKPRANDPLWQFVGGKWKRRPWWRRLLDAFVRGMSTGAGRKVSR